MISIYLVVLLTTKKAYIQGKRPSLNDVLATYPYLDVGGFQFWDHNKAGFGTIGF